MTNLLCLLSPFSRCLLRQLRFYHRIPHFPAKASKASIEKLLIHQSISSLSSPTSYLCPRTMATQAPTPQDRPVTQSLNCGSHDNTANSLATQNGYSTTNETLHTRSQKSNGFTHPSETKPNGYSSPPAKNMDDLSTYDFPVGKLSTFMHDPSKTPLLLVACGSFSPITYLHLRMFEIVADYVRFKTDFEIVGGYLSPVSDAYKKKGLASAKDRSVIVQTKAVVRGC